MPGYASGQLHRGLANDDLAGAAREDRVQGLPAISNSILALTMIPTRAGGGTGAAGARAVGPHVTWADVNERWSVGKAIDIGRRLEEIGLFWLEDPTSGRRLRGTGADHRRIIDAGHGRRKQLGRRAVQTDVGGRSVDILMIDLMHVGGITPWMKIAAMAEAFNVPVVSHIMPEFQAQLVAAIPNGLIAEHKAWTWRLFEGVPEFATDFVLSDRPGHGLSIGREFEKLT